ARQLAARVDEIASLPARGELLLELEEVAIAVEGAQLLEQQRDALLEAARRRAHVRERGVGEARLLEAGVAQLLERPRHEEVHRPRRGVAAAPHQVEQRRAAG